MNTMTQEKKKNKPLTEQAQLKTLSAAPEAPETGAAGSYGSDYDRQLKELYDSIANREDFSYDLNGDALYEQYREAYRQQGMLASRDAIGQAAALSGGYASSYAQSVGQQQYDSYLQRLNDVVPELYSAAAQRYDAEGTKLNDLYSKTAQARDDWYEKQIAQAEQMAQYGDFSLYKQLYGEEQGTLMENTWLVKNAKLALKLGIIDQKKYRQLIR